MLWTELGVLDLEEIVAFVARESPAAAKRVLGAVSAKARSLKTFPHRGHLVPELAHFGIRSWLELVVPPYRLIYRIEDHRVQVLALLDGRRDLQDILLGRLTRTS
ncbi:MAG: type II toxin-antitoxin system RelE/ParE family toxin [Planctomycetota bacterium]